MQIVVNTKHGFKYFLGKIFLGISMQYPLYTCADCGNIISPFLWYTSAEEKLFASADVPHYAQTLFDG